MTQRNARRLLIAAFAVSLLLHAILALNIRPRPPEVPADIEVVQIVRRAIAIHAQTPPPPPRVHHTPAPANSPAPKATSKGKAPSGTGGSGTTPTAAPTAAPTPAATVATNPCGRNDAEAAVSVEPSPPDIPVSARADGTSGIAVIKVHLDATGAVTSADVSQTSGNQQLDSIATSLARQAQYTPALHDCKAVASEYQFSVRFAAW